MKKILLLLLLTFSYFIVNAQFGGGGRMGQMSQTAPSQQPVDDTPKGNVKLTGILLDSATNKPVEYGSVALYWNKKVVDGAMADMNGNFVLKNFLLIYYYSSYFFFLLLSASSLYSYSFLRFYSYS